MRNPNDKTQDPIPDDSEGLAPTVGEPVDVKEDQDKDAGKQKDEPAKIPLTE